VLSLANSEIREDKMTNDLPKDITESPSSSKWYLVSARWFFSLDPMERRPTEPAEVLYRSFHITSKCRYNASIRLNRIGSFSFLTATLLSLGLILIPLIQLSDMPLAYPEQVLGILQVFFAVAVLTYSVINSTAHYETRAKSLNECGDSIKDLSRKLRSASFQAGTQGTELDLQPINEMCSRISTASENHSRTDYCLAMLQASELYHVTGFPRLWLNIKVLYGNLEVYILPFVLILAEIIVILDMLSVTRVLTGIFNSAK
jgi:hypothetical protein